MKKYCCKRCGADIKYPGLCDKCIDELHEMERRFRKSSKFNYKKEKEKMLDIIVKQETKE